LLTVITNPVYSEQPLDLTCIYDHGYILMNITMEAFNHTYKKGFLSCHTRSSNTTGIGVFSGSKFSECSPTSRKVTLSMTASTSLELDFRCTVTLHRNNSFTTLSSATVFVVVLGKFIKYIRAWFSSLVRCRLLIVYKRYRTTQHSNLGA